MEGIITKAATAGPLQGDDIVSAAVHDLKVNWSVIEGDELVIWAYNMDSAPLTTGALLRFAAEWMGVWLRD